MKDIELETKEIQAKIKKMKVEQRHLKTTIADFRRSWTAFKKRYEATGGQRDQMSSSATSSD